MLLLRRRDLVCQEVVELVTAYLDGSLSRSARKRFERHLAACPNCTAYLEQMRVTIALTGTLGADDVAPEAAGDLTELYRQWLEGDRPGEAAGGSDDGPGGDGAGG